jgi:hypothetical protein
VSIQCVAWVLEYSDARLGARLVLLALANHAHDDGSNSFPSQARIAAEARLTDRQVRRCLKELMRLGAITRSGTVGELRRNGAISKSVTVPREVVVWRVTMSTDKLSDPPDKYDTPPGQIRPKPGRKCPTNRKEPSSNREEDRFSPLDKGIIYEEDP